MPYFTFINSFLMPAESKRTQGFLCAAHYNKDNISALTNGVAATVFSTANTITYLTAIPFRLLGLSLRDNNELPFFERVFEQIDYSTWGVIDAIRSIGYTVFFCVPYLAIGALGSIFYNKDATRIFTYAIEPEWLAQTTQAQLRELITSCRNDYHALGDESRLRRFFGHVTFHYFHIKLQDTPSTDELACIAAYDAILDPNSDLSTIQKHKQQLQQFLKEVSIDEITDVNLFQEVRDDCRDSIKCKLNKVEKRLEALQEFRAKAASLEAELAALRQFTIKENPDDATAKFFIAFAKKITELNQKSEATEKDNKWIEAYNQIMHKDSGLSTLQNHEEVLNELGEFDLTDLERFKAVREEIRPQIEKHLNAQDDFINQVQKLTKEKDAALKQVAVLEGQLKEMTKNRDAVSNRVTELENALKTAQEVTSSSTATPSDDETKGKGEADLPDPEKPDNETTSVVDKETGSSDVAEPSKKEADLPDPEKPDNKTTSVVNKETGSSDVAEPSKKEAEQSDGEEFKAEQSDSTSSSRSNSDADFQSSPSTPRRPSSPPMSDRLRSLNTPLRPSPCTITSKVNATTAIMNARDNIKQVETHYIGPYGAIKKAMQSINSQGSADQKAKATLLEKEARQYAIDLMNFLTTTVDINNMSTENLNDEVDYKNNKHTKQWALKLTGTLMAHIIGKTKEIYQILEEIKPKATEGESSEAVA